MAAVAGLDRIATRLPELSERLAIAEANTVHETSRASETSARLDAALESLETRVQQIEQSRALSTAAGGQDAGGGLLAALKGMDLKTTITAVLLMLALLGSGPAQRVLGFSDKPNIDEIARVLDERIKADKTEASERPEEREGR